MKRRNLLRLLALGAGAMPALPGLGSRFLSNAHAATGGGVRRVVFCYIPSGLPRASWHVAQGSTERSFQLGDQLVPLERHRSNMVVLQNLELVQSCTAQVGTQTICPGGTPDGHATAEVQLLTGHTELLPYIPSHAQAPIQSVDNYLADQLGRVVTPAFPILRLGIQNNGARWSWTGAKQRADMEKDPYKVYASLFSNLTGTTPDMAPPAPDPALLRRLARRQSVLDFLSKDVQRFQAQLGSEDRLRAQAQLDAIRTLEARLSDSMGGGAVSGVDPDSCGRRPLVDAAGGLDPADDRNVPQMTELMRKNIVGAFACDLTRVVSIGCYSNDQALHMRFDPIAKEEDFHHFSHDGDSDNFATLLLCRRYFMENFVGKLADELAALPEGEGTMLDNTLIFVFSEHGLNHSHNAQQWLTLGGKNLGVDVGKYLKCGESEILAGTEHNRMLVSVLKAMGLPDETFGEEVLGGSGTLSGFIG